MRIYSTWNNSNKQADKCQVKLRIGRLTVFDYYTDFSAKKWALTIMNFTLKP